jgi:hypothetical protein
VLPDVRNGRLVQLVAAGDCEELVINVHAVFFVLDRSACFECWQQAAAAHLIARVHVDASPKAVVQAAIFLVVAVLCGDGHTAGTG